MTRRKHKAEEQQNAYAMQSPTSSTGQKYPISSGFYFIPRDEPRGASPVGESSPTSFSSNTARDRDSQQVEYHGPLMPELPHSH